MKSLQQLLSDFKNISAQQKKLIDATPRIMGVESVKIVKENFKLQGYDSGIGFTKWPSRKAATNAAYDRGKKVNSKNGKLSKYRSGKNGTYKGSVFSSQKPILMQTLTLFNSIDYKLRGKRVFTGVNTSIVPYSIAHNEGLHHEPKRKFMPTPNEPPNQKIINVIRKKLDIETERIMKNFKI